MNKKWRSKPLGEVLEVQNGYAFDSKGFNASKGIPLVRIRDLKQGTETETRFSGDYDEKYVVNRGDLLIGMDGEFGCYEWKGDCALLNQRVCRLQGINGELVPRFLLYGLNSHLKAIEDVTGYATVKHLSSKQILAIPFPFPPITEQRRIVGILDNAFEGIATAKANAEKNLRNARALFESHLRAVFGRRGKDWVECRLEDLCERVSVGHVGPTARFYCDEADGVPFVRSQNVRRGRLDFEAIRYVTKEFHQKLRKSQLRPRDLLFVRVGANRGDCCFVPDGIGEVNCANVVFARPVKANSAYIARYSDSAEGRAQLLGMTTGAAQGVINTSSVAQLVVPLPPQSEQERIVSSVDELQAEVERLACIYERKRLALDTLKKSLLHHAFTGNL